MASEDLGGRFDVVHRINADPLAKLVHEAVVSSQDSASLAVAAALRSDTGREVVARELQLARPEGKPARTYYRSLEPDGTLWCESRDPVEVRRMTHPDQPLTYERMDVCEATEGWRPWRAAKSAGDDRA